MKKSGVFVPKSHKNAGLFLWGRDREEKNKEEGERKSAAERAGRRGRKYLDFSGDLAGFAGKNEGVYQRLQKKEMENP